MAESGYYNDAQVMTDAQLRDRKDECLQLFLTQPMERWARHLAALADTLRLTEPQLVQFRRFIYRNHPGLYDRVVFMHCTQNNPAPSHPVVNPADRHFDPEAQTRLRHIYNNVPKTEVELRAWVSSDLKNHCTHQTKDQTIIQHLALIWWDCQHDATNSNAARLDPGYHFDDMFLMRCLLECHNSNPDIVINKQALANNMWRYNVPRMETYMTLCSLTLNDAGAIYQMASTQLSTNIGFEIFTTQDRLKVITEAMFPESVAVWNGREASMTMTPMISQIAGRISLAVELLQWIHDKLYIQAILQRSLIHHLTDLFLYHLNLLDDGETRKHQSLRRRYETLNTFLAKRHQVFQEQQGTIRRHNDWFVANVYNHDFKVPKVEMWHELRPLLEHPHQHDE